MGRVISLILLIIGAKGAGKTSVMKVLQSHGFIGITNESKYLQYGAMYPDRDINKDEAIQDKIYSEVEQEITEAVKCGNVAYEATGTNKRWSMLKKRLQNPHFTIKVVCPADIVLERLRKRIWDENYAATQGHITNVQKKSHHTPCDFTIDNSGPIEALEPQVSDILRKIREKT